MSLEQQVRDKIKGYLDAIYADSYSEINEHFTVSQGSALVEIVVRPWKDDDVVVECFSYVIQGAGVTPELMRRLLRLNATIHFGAFGLIFDDTVVFGHAIAGANLDRNEFEASLKMVAAVADHYDDELKAEFGGSRSVDLLEE